MRLTGWKCCVFQAAKGSYSGNLQLISDMSFRYGGRTKIAFDSFSSVNWRTS